MHCDYDITRIIEEIEYLCAKRRRAAKAHMRLIMVHGHHARGTICLPGETIEGAYLLCGQKQSLPLSPTGLAVLDCLSHHQYRPLTAGQIARILASHLFYRRLGANAPGGVAPVSPRRDVIKVYIERIRRQYKRILRNPVSIIASEKTDLNIVAYRLTIRAEVVHEGIPGKET